MDISNLTYKELVNLEEEIVKRKKEIKKVEYEGLVNGIISDIKAIIRAGFEDTECFCECGNYWTWGDLMVGISQEFERREEDY